MFDPIWWRPEQGEITNDCGENHEDEDEGGGDDDDQVDVIPRPVGAQGAAGAIFCQVTGPKRRGGGLEKKLGCNE